MAYLGLETIRRGNTAACVQDIFTLHFPHARNVLDLTYGAGRFWNWPHALTITGLDIDPPPPAITRPPQGGLAVWDYRRAQECPLVKANGPYDVLTFDPPFIFSKGLRRVIGTKRFFMGAERAEIRPEARTYANDPIQLPKNPADLLEHYRRVFEQRRLGAHGLILKGQDLIVSKPDWWSFNVFNLAKEMGLGEPADILIQHSPASRMKDPRWKNQYHLRRAHCLYLIYKFEPTKPLKVT